MEGDARVRNISNAGKRNRFYGSIILFLFAIIVNIVYLVVGNPLLRMLSHGYTLKLLKSKELIFLDRAIYMFDNLMGLKYELRALKY